MKTLALLLFLVLTVYPAIAQQEEEVERSPKPIIATVASGTRVHSSPGGPAISTLAADAEVRVVGTANGWMRVRSPGNRTGWVDHRFLRPKDSHMSFAPRTFTRFQHGDHAPCAADLSQCAKIGCATDDPTHALFNEVKHGPGVGQLARLPLTAFTALQSQATQLVGEAAELTAAERASIRDFAVGNITTGEGHIVAVTGFIVGTPPHANSGESVNCNLTKKDENDFHISVAQGPDQTAFQSIVVEMIPQDRNPGWTLTKLKDVEAKKRRVMVTGQLFYDNAHRVNKNPQHSLSGEPKRFSLWEVHPIRQFLVCTSASCDVNDQSQWTKLEDMPEPHG